MLFGGDEISALVLDIGSSSTRAGYAGEDVPKAIFPTSYGYTQQISQDESGAEKKEARLFLGEQVNQWRPRMEVANPMQNGLISDFAPIPSIVSHALTHTLRCNPTEHPVLVTESPWNTPANRERMAEIMFEEFNVPAFYIANSAVLSSFAAGKGSALVIDIGKSTASVTPVSDGFVLRKGMAYSALPPLVHSTSYHLLATPNNNPLSLRAGISLLPHSLISSKSAVELNKPPKSILREDRIKVTTESWRTWAESCEVEEWVNGVSGVLENGWNEGSANTRPSKHYEFPSGFNTLFGAERFIPGEIYFNQSHLPPNPSIIRPQTQPSLIANTLQACDPDIRPILLGNVVLTGGGSLLSGMSDRIFYELSRTYPGHKVKLHAPGNPTERRYSSWLGGSVLASLGTFHQLWISAEEWQEHGKAIVGQRCK